MRRGRGVHRSETSSSGSIAQKRLGGGGGGGGGGWVGGSDETRAEGPPMQTSRGQSLGRDGGRGAYQRGVWGGSLEG